MRGARSPSVGSGVRRAVLASLSWSWIGFGVAIGFGAGLEIGEARAQETGNQEAQQTDDVSSDPPELPRIYSTATVIDRPISSTTSTVFVIERATIEALAARSVADLLRFVPGVHLLTDGSRGGSTAAQIRGGDPNFTLVLLDGIPLNDTNDQQGGAFNLNSLPTETIDRIEVVSGPLSAHFGSTGLAGAINIITRVGSPIAGTAAPARQGPTINATIEGGSASLIRASTGISNWRQSHDYSATLQFEREQGRIGDDRFEQFDAQARLGLRPSATTDLRLAGRFANWEADDYPIASGGPTFGSGELRASRNDELSLGADLTLSPTDRRQFRVNASVYRHTLERTSPAVPPLVPAIVEDARFTRARLGAAVVLRTSDVGFISAGFDVTRESGDVASVLALPPFLGGDIAGDYDITRTFGGPFAELVLELDDVIVEVGTRVDFSDSTDAEVSPRFGIAYRFGNDTRIRSSVGRAFKLPSFFALASPRALGGNPDLRPETSWGADLGLQHEWREVGMNVGVTVFYNRFSDLVDFDFETFQNINRNAVETRGAELSLGWRADDRFNVDLTVTYQEVEDLSSPEPLLQRPEWLSSFRGSWQAHDRVLLALDAQQVSGSFDRQLPVPDRDRVDGRTLLGMSGIWDVTSQVSAVARADNLANATYETLIGFPGPSRSIRVGLRYTGR